jgi:soluble lytic murein transglycosylase-like protein
MQNVGSRTRRPGLNPRDVSRTLSAATQSPRLQKSVLFFSALLLAMAIFACQHGAKAAGLHRAHRHHAPAAEATVGSYDLLHRWDAMMQEASGRFDLPVEWIRAVMTRESGGRIMAVSRVGAVGLMQLMPGTYDEMRRQFGLGHNRFDPRDNILAGTAYLKSLNVKYGVAGMFAAYNAGPGAYERSLSGGSLPQETQAYVQHVSAQLGLTAAGSTPVATLNTDTAQRVSATYLAAAAPVQPVSVPPQPAVPGNS